VHNFITACEKIQQYLEQFLCKRYIPLTVRCLKASLKMQLSVLPYMKKNHIGFLPQQI